MAMEEVPEPESSADQTLESQEATVAEEAADFITSQVLDKDATFFEG